MKILTTGFTLLLAISTVLAQHPLTGSENVFNSYADELNPILSADGQTIYFTRGHHSDNIGGRPDPGDIWYSTLDDSARWTAPVPLPGNLNNKHFNGVIGWRQGGTLLYGNYGSSSRPPGARGVSYMRELPGSQQLSTPKAMNIKYFKDLSELHGYSLSGDGKILILSMESYKTAGAEDIYVSFWDASANLWSEPLNLGSQVNTPLQELTPYLSPDKRTLYFSSNGHPGFGSRDIFYTERLDNSWTNWSEPKNMGPEINTAGAEMYFQYLPEFELAMFTSTTNSDGYGDLRFKDYSVQAMQELTGAEIIVPADTVLAVEPVIPVIQKPIGTQDKIIEFVQVRGEIRASASNEFVASHLELNSVIDSVEFTKLMESSGSFTFNLPEPGQYVLTVSAAGYISKNVQLSITHAQDSILQVNILLDPIEVGTTVQLEHVLFQRGTTELLESSFNELDLIARMMLDNPGMEIRLAGHTDNQGNGRLNKILSQQRVNTVIEYLTGKGVESDRLSGKGYGGSQPIASNANEETRKLNRRVEFTVIKE
jgi:outer membrane protein OmpA-like peptidoglycan-associated protein